MNSNDNHSHLKKRIYKKNSEEILSAVTAPERANGGDGQCSVAAGQDFSGRIVVWYPPLGLLRFLISRA